VEYWFSLDTDTCTTAQPMSVDYYERAYMLIAGIRHHGPSIWWVLNDSETGEESWSGRIVNHPDDDDMFEIFDEVRDRADFMTNYNILTVFEPESRWSIPERFRDTVKYVIKG
jgi:hypothetical protein